MIYRRSWKAAARLDKIEPSGIRRMFSSGRNVPNVVNLGLGEPDFPPPLHVLEATKRALDEGKTRYTPSTGIPELLEALARKAKQDYGLSYDPNTEILVTVGGTEAIFLALQALVNLGDEVLVPSPGFVCYKPSVLLASGTPVSMAIVEDDGFRIDANVVMSQITTKSRLMIVNSPNNPTGAVFSYNDLMSLAKIAGECDLLVISDEVYEKITYDDAKHYCLATFPEMRDRTLIIGSFSKTYAMTGFRVGYIYGPEALMAPLILAHQFCVACVDGLSQYAALAALEGPQDSVKEMVSEFDRRRRLLHSGLNKISGFHSNLPEGAFYLFAGIQHFGAPSEKLAEHLLKEGRVITVPGSAFGKYGEGYLRFSYATAYDKIEEALDRIEKASQKFQTP